MPQQGPSAGTPEQAQAKPPQVTYEAGSTHDHCREFKIVGYSARSLRACMGADIDLPQVHPGSVSGTVWARSRRKVLAMLLSGTKLDYIIRRLILIRTGSGMYG